MDVPERVKLSGDPQSVRLYCADVSHEGRIAQLATFVRTNGDWNEVQARTKINQLSVQAWNELDKPATEVSGKQSFESIMARTPPKADGPTAVDYLIGDTPSKLIKSAASADGRRRFSRKCPLCDLTVPVRWEKLEWVLEKLAGAKVLKLSLTDLAAIVSRT